MIMSGMGIDVLAEALFGLIPVIVPMVLLVLLMSVLMARD
jgi:hypothetical protein